MRAFVPLRRKPLFVKIGALAGVALFAASVVMAADRKPAAKPSGARPVKRAVDPALLPVEDTAGLPRVLLIGDSISMGYTPPVREMLKGKANIHHPPENCGDTGRGLEHLDRWLGDKHWDVIHFNFGLHDLKWLDAKGQYVSPDKGKQVNPLPQYEKNLRDFVARLKKTGARLVWCSTTPVPDGTAGRVHDVELEYNAVAAKIAAENGIPIDDLHAVAKARQAEIQRPKNVHFTPAGSKVLAESVVRSIEKALHSSRVAR